MWFGFRGSMAVSVHWRRLSSPMYVARDHSAADTLLCKSSSQKRTWKTIDLGQAFRGTSSREINTALYYEHRRDSRCAANRKQVQVAVEVNL